MCFVGVVCFVMIFFFKQKTAYEMRISDWSSDVCSSDLAARGFSAFRVFAGKGGDRHGGRSPGAACRIGAFAGPADATACGCGEIGRASCRERVCQYV